MNATKQAEILNIIRRMDALHYGATVAYRRGLHEEVATNMRAWHALRERMESLKQ